MALFGSGKKPKTVPKKVERIAISEAVPTLFSKSKTSDLPNNDKLSKNVPSKKRIVTKVYINGTKTNSVKTM